MTDVPQSHRPPTQLAPVLGVLSATAIVVGGVIGSGIFFKPSVIAKELGGNVGMILLLWAVCGLVNLFGALAQAELAGMYPHAGGTYVFLREAYGRLWSFLWAWAEFWVVRSGSIAALAVYSAMGLRQLTMASGGATTVSADSIGPLVIKSTAVAFIVALGLINAAGVYWGGMVQNAMTVVKIATVATLAALPLVALPGQPAQFDSWWPSGSGALSLSGIGTALAAIMWAYDGWGNVPVVAEEIHNPERNVPRALLTGVVILIALYLGANLAYHWALPTAEILKPPVGATAAETLWDKVWPGYGPRLMLGLIMVSTLGALNSNVLVGPRVLFAAARDHQWIGRLAQVHARVRTPLLSIFLMCGWSVLLVLFLGEMNAEGKRLLCDVLTDYCIFGGSIFYLLAVLAVFVLRRTHPGVPRPYRAWGYPLLPAVFVAFYVFFLASMFRAQPTECSVGLTLIVLGGVVYGAIYWRPRGAGRQ